MFGAAILLAGLVLECRPGPWASEQNALSHDEARAGYHLLFNGRDLSGWSGHPNVWFVEDGAIVDIVDEKAASGLIALQLHRGEPMRVEFRNIKIKVLAAEKGNRHD